MEGSPAPIIQTLSGVPCFWFSSTMALARLAADSIGISPILVRAAEVVFSVGASLSALSTVAGS
ncbi:hypothetical protein D9M68_878730 [compost metagenome]